MTKLSSRTQIADADISASLLIHLVKQGVPKTSWKSTIDKIIPSHGGNTFVVSPDGNSDIAGVAQWMSYATIAEAQSAASSGDTILVSPGAYAEGALGKNGVNYFFFPGASITFASVIWVADAISFSVYGYGVFSATGGDGVGRPLRAINAGVIYMEAESLNGTNIGGANVQATTGAFITVKLKKDFTATGYGFGANAATIIASGRRLITGTSLINTTATTAKVTCDFDENIVLNTGAEAFSYGINYAGGQVDLYGKLIISSACAVAASAIVVAASAGGSVTDYINVWGDIEVNQAASSILTVNASWTLTVNIYGRCYFVAKSSAASFTISNANVKVNLYNDIIGTISGDQIITLTDGVLKLKGFLHNQSNTAGADGIVYDGGTLILDGAVIKTTHASSISITTTSGSRLFQVHKTSIANKDTNTSTVSSIGDFIISSSI